MKIVSIYYTHKPGGFCKRLYRLLNSLGSHDHQITYLCLDAPPNGATNGVSFERVEFSTMRRAGLSFWLRFLPLARKQLADWASRNHPDRIVVFNPIYAWIAAPAARMAKCKLVLFQRSVPWRTNQLNGTLWPVRAISNWLERSGLHAASRIVIQTKAMENEVVRFAGPLKAELCTLPNDAPRPLAIGEPITRTGAIGSGVISRSKNYLLVLRALRLLPPELATAVGFTLLGSGPARDELYQSTRELKLTNVTFPGWVDNPWPILSAHRYFLHPSVDEGMSNAVLEGLSAGLIVLAARTPESAELLGSDELLFDATNPDELADKLRQLEASPMLRTRYQELAATAHARLSFDWDAEAVELVVRP